MNLPYRSDGGSQLLVAPRLHRGRFGRGRDSGCFGACTRPTHAGRATPEWPTNVPSSIERLDTAHLVVDRLTSDWGHETLAEHRGANIQLRRTYGPVTRASESSPSSCFLRLRISSDLTASGCAHPQSRRAPFRAACRSVTLGSCVRVVVGWWRWVGVGRACGRCCRGLILWIWISPAHMLRDTTSRCMVET